MKVLPLFMFIILLFTILPSYSQDPEMLREKLKELMKKSPTTLPSETSWIAINQDSSFFKKRIVQLYHANTMPSWDKQKQTYVEWKFYNSSTFKLVDRSQYGISGPGLGKGRMFKLKIQLVDKKLYIATKNMLGRKEWFRVIGLEEKDLSNGPSCHILTLLRE